MDVHDCDDSVALVLAGSVAQGAFGVGAAMAVAKRGWPVQRIAATSSGALTAAVIGAGVATGRFLLATEVARDQWIRHGAFHDFGHVSLSNLWRGRGLLDTSRLVSVVEEGIARVVGDPPAPVVRPD